MFSSVSYQVLPAPSNRCFLVTTGAGSPNSLALLGSLSHDPWDCHGTADQLSPLSNHSWPDRQSYASPMECLGKVVEASLSGLGDPWVATLTEAATRGAYIGLLSHINNYVFPAIRPTTFTFNGASTTCFASPGALGRCRWCFRCVASSFQRFQSAARGWLLGAASPKTPK